MSTQTVLEIQEQKNLVELSKTFQKKEIFYKTAVCLIFLSTLATAVATIFFLPHLFPILHIIKWYYWSPILVSIIMEKIFEKSQIIMQKGNNAHKQHKFYKNSEITHKNIESIDEKLPSQKSIDAFTQNLNEIINRNKIIEDEDSIKKYLQNQDTALKEKTKLFDEKLAIQESVDLVNVTVKPKSFALYVELYNKALAKESKLKALKKKNEPEEKTRCKIHILKQKWIVAKLQMAYFKHCIRNPQEKKPLEDFVTIHTISYAQYKNDANHPILKKAGEEKQFTLDELCHADFDMETAIFEQQIAHE